MQPYKDGTSLEDIITDGWARGFERGQTIGEAALRGYSLTDEQLKKEWGNLDKKLELYIQKIKNEEKYANRIKQGIYKNS